MATPMSKPYPKWRSRAITIGWIAVAVVSGLIILGSLSEETSDPPTTRNQPETPQPASTTVPPASDNDRILTRVDTTHSSTATRPRAPDSTITATRTKTPNRESPPMQTGGETSSASSELDALREYALELINEDRRRHGVGPVRLGSNRAAQLHAEDALRSGYYVGHWTTDGLKPYMLYTLTGGVGIVAENASGRWYDASGDCDLPDVVCPVQDPYEAVESLQWAMMYDDAESDWGHRDTIINPDYDIVNIGIDYSETGVAYYQHFERVVFRYREKPTFTQGILRLWLQPNSDIEVGPIAVFYDDPPSPRTPQEIGRLHAYCTGGGFTDRCEDVESVGVILEPPPSNARYVDLPEGSVIASVWERDSMSLAIEADIGRLSHIPGVYTLLYVDDESGALIGMYSLWIGLPDSN